VEGVARTWGHGRGETVGTGGNGGRTYLIWDATHSWMGMIGEDGEDGEDAQIWRSGADGAHGKHGKGWGGGSN